METSSDVPIRTWWKHGNIKFWCWLMETSSSVPFQVFQPLQPSCRTWWRNLNHRYISVRSQNLLTKCFPLVSFSVQSLFTTTTVDQPGPRRSHRSVPAPYMAASCLLWLASSVPTPYIPHGSTTTHCHTAATRCRITHQTTACGCGNATFPTNEAEISCCLWSEWCKVTFWKHAAAWTYGRLTDRSKYVR